MRFCWSTFAHSCNASANFQGNLRSNQACSLGIYFPKADTLIVFWHIIVQLSFACDMLPSTINECSSEMAGHFLFCQIQQRSVNLWQILKVGFKRNSKPFFFNQSVSEKKRSQKKRGWGNLWKWELHCVSDLALHDSGFMLINTFGIRWHGLYAIK